MKGIGNEMSPEQQELLSKLSKYEPQIQQLQRQLQAVEESTMELKSLDFGLDEIENVFKDNANDKKDSDDGKEILAQIGRGVFVEAKLTSDKLTVDVGNKNFVKKSIPETKKIIKDQIKKLEEVKEDLDRNLDELNEEITRVISDSQQKESEE